MTQALLWQDDIEHNDDYAKLCNALYERELATLSSTDNLSIQSLQARLKSLPYYIKRTADHMTLCQCPLDVDVQNGSWALKQPGKMPNAAIDFDSIAQWFAKAPLPLGLVVPIQTVSGFDLDSIVRFDQENKRLRTNAYGWFSFNQEQTIESDKHSSQLVKPTKKVMMLACAGHRWANEQKKQPKRLSLRELLLSCSINWKNFKKTAQPVR